MKVIINHIKNKNEEGLRLLYNHYGKSLFSIAFSVLHNQAHTEDTIQKSFLKIWESIHSFDDSKASFYTWAATIVKRTAIDTRRLMSFQKEEKTETYDINVHTHETTEQQTDQMDVLKLLGDLDDKYAIVLDYLYLKGYSQRDLAKELDMPLGTIKTRVKKAIDILRDRLKNEKEYLLGFIIILYIVLKILIGSDC